jgi:hypothetical protein
MFLFNPHKPFEADCSFQAFAHIEDSLPLSLRHVPLEIYTPCGRVIAYQMLRFYISDHIRSFDIDPGCFHTKPVAFSTYPYIYMLYCRRRPFAGLARLSLDWDWVTTHFIESYFIRNPSTPENPSLDIRSTMYNCG